MQAARPSRPWQPTATILLIEDDLALADALAAEGYRVRCAADAAAAGALFDEERPDLVILDLILPDADGLVLLSDLRARWPGPIVLLSGTRRERDRILGLRLGADDFVAKPFDAHELLARVEAVLRRGAVSRPHAEEPEICHVGPLTVDVWRRTVTHHDRPVRLTPIEFRLLATLASEAEKAFTREELAARVWGDPAIGQRRLIDVHIRRLRQRLDKARVTDPTIVTLRSFGYQLSPSRRARSGPPDG
jgi:two-component system response regulator MtrA